MRQLTRFAVTHRRLVFVLWVVALLAAGAASGAAGSHFRNVFTLPGTDTQRAQDLLKERFPQQSGESAQIVFHTDRGTLTGQRVRIDRALAAARRAPDVASVTSPFAGGRAVSRDGRTGFATVSYSKTIDNLTKDEVQKLVDATRAQRGGGLQVELGGQPVELTTQQQGSSTELIGLLAAAVVLVMTFGSLLAAGMPLLTAVLSLGTGLGLVTLLSSVMNVADFAPQLASMIGLGVGIDYALFIVTRYREELGGGRDYRAAAERAMATAGRAVLFAGSTVVIALLGMMLLGISFLYGVAVAASIAVLLTMFAALTLLPALLVALGPRIDKWRVGRRRVATTNDGGGWARWARWVERRPGVAALAGLLVVLVLAIPVLQMRLGSSDAGNDRPGTTTRKAYDLLARGFGPGFSGPFLVAADLRGSGQKARALRELRAAIAGQPGIAGVTPPQLNPARDTAVLQAYPRSSPQARQTKDTLSELRGRAVPPIERSTDVDVAIGGSTAGNADFNQVVTSKLPLFIGIVVALSVLLLMVAFRSVLVPLKAAVMNVLSIGASFGVVVAVFQRGWGASLLGVHTTGPIESFLPVMVFAIVFGLSMDYEVFLMSRVHEEWSRTGDARAAMTYGLARTGRVITAAAMIMVVVFASFILLDDRVIKLFGLGLASAVFIDAFLIRSLLVPAVMQLLGAHAWWLPSWLDRRLPHLDVEGAEAAEPAGA